MKKRLLILATAALLALGLSACEKQTEADTNTDTETESIEISRCELRTDAFACLADPCENYRSPGNASDSFRNIEVSVLSFPSGVRTAVAELAAIGLYDYVHVLILIL